MIEKNWKILALLGAIAVLLVAAFLLLSDDGGDRRRAGPGGASGDDPFRFGGDSPGTEKPGDVRIPTANVLRDYKEWAKYPPDSRPLLKDHRDEIRPAVIRGTSQRMVILDPTTKKPKLSEYYCLLEPKTHTAIGTEPHQLTLRCNKPPSRKPVPLEIVEVRLERRTQDNKLVRLPVPTVGDQGRDGDERAGDRIYTFQWRPRTVDWGNMELTVRFNVPDEEASPARTYQLMTAFFSSPHAPARFTGTVNEQIIDGSLVLSVQLRVSKAGDYEIKGNLFAGEEPVAISRGRATLKPGLQTVDLLFFGKIFHDRGTAGPYTLRNLRGIRENLAISPSELASKTPEEVNRMLEESTKRREASEPDRELIPYATEDFKTRAYTLRDFSPKEFESVQKTQRIKMLEEDVRRGQ